MDNEERCAWWVNTRHNDGWLVEMASFNAHIAQANVTNMARISQIKYIEAMIIIWKKQNGKCANCGRYYLDPPAMGFAHLVSKNKLTDSQLLTHVVFVCPELHRYEHTRANNLLTHPCVALCEKKHGGVKEFYKKILDGMAQQ